MNDFQRRRIRILIVDDSLLFRQMLSIRLSAFPDLEVVGSAGDPYEALDKIYALNPDVITMDIEMPKMDGIRFLQRLMPVCPRSVVVISGLKESVLDALAAGAAEFMTKPEDGGWDSDVFLDYVAEKVRAASQVQAHYDRADCSFVNMTPLGMVGTPRSDQVVALGASTGGTEAICSILSKFSSNMPGFVVALHMPAGFTKLFARRLDDTCRIRVREARDGDLVDPGTALVAPGDYHMRLVPAGDGFAVALNHEEKVNGHRPSVDILFSSVAETAADRTVGVILTGMGTDGAKGLLRIRKAGGYTIGQDRRSSVVYGMPMAAMHIGAVARQLPLYRIPEEICGKIAVR